MRKRQAVLARTARRLPASFVPRASALTDLFPEWYRAVQLFKEIAERDGIDEAERIFTDVVKRARQAVKPLPPGKRQPPPKKQKGRSHNPLADHQWLSVYDMLIQQKLPEDEAKAKAIDFIERHIRRPGQNRAAIKKHLGRLLAGRNQDK